MDSYYLNNAVYLMEEFLENSKDPYYKGHIEYGDRFSHCWYGNHEIPADVDRFTLIQRLAPEMMKHMLKTAPPGADTTSWRY
jgi:hypothetical protein